MGSNPITYKTLMVELVDTLSLEFSLYKVWVQVPLKVLLNRIKACLVELVDTVDLKSTSSGVSVQFR